MRELSRPPEVEDDPKATEMIRVWIAHDDIHVSLLLGLWEDVDEWEVEEHEGWGQVLADLVQHIAHGMQQSHGWSKQDTVRRIADAFNKTIAQPEGEVSGEYVE